MLIFLLLIFFYLLEKFVTYFFLFTRKIKKIRREKGKLRHKMDMKMIIPGDRHDFSDDIGLFNLGKIKNKAVCI